MFTLSVLLATMQASLQNAKSIIQDISRRAPGSLTTQTLVVGALFGLVIYRLTKKASRLPPGPRPLPLLGNLLSMRSEKEAFYMTLARWARHKYGPVITVYFGPVPCVTLNNSQVVTEALVEKGADFAGRPMLYSIELITDGFKNIAFASVSSLWKLQRKIAVQALKQYMNRPHFEQVLHKAVSLTINKFLAEPGAFDPHLYTSSLIFIIINSMCFGDDKLLDDSCNEHFMTIFDKINTTFSNGVLEDIIPILRYWPTKKLKTLISLSKEFTSYVDENVAEHRTTFSPDNIRNLTDSVLLAQSETEKDEREAMTAFTDIHVGQTMSDLFAAGWDTSRMTMDWVILFLAAHPQIQQRVQAEVDSVTEGGELPGLKARHHLHYTQAVLYEAMRLAPTVPTAIPHSTMCDTSVGGYHIPKDTMVLINVWAVTHDPDRWEKPDHFIPDRFLDEQGKVRGKMEGWIPFSAGRRACLGESMAKVELTVLLACLLKRLTFSLPPGAVYDPAYDLSGGLLVHMAKPFKIVVTERH